MFPRNVLSGGTFCCPSPSEQMTVHWQKSMSPHNERYISFEKCQVCVLYSLFYFIISSQVASPATPLTPCLYPSTPPIKKLELERKLFFIKEMLSHLFHFRILCFQTFFCSPFKDFDTFLLPNILSPWMVALCLRRGQGYLAYLCRQAQPTLSVTKRGMQHCSEFRSVSITMRVGK